MNACMRLGNSRILYPTGPSGCVPQDVQVLHRLCWPLNPLTHMMLQVT